MSMLSPCGSAVEFQISLDSAQEVPAPLLGGASPSGSAIVTVDTLSGEVGVSGSYSGMTSDVTAAHVHGPAAPGLTAGVVFGLSPSGGTSGTFTGAGTFTDGEIEELLAGNLYINVHTTINGPGEVRGQIVDLDIQTAKVRLDTEQEVPAPVSLGDASPSGFARVVVDRSSGRVEISGEYSDMSGNVSGSHLHGAASPGTTAGVLMNLANDGGLDGSFSGTGNLAGAGLTALFDGRTYLNVHTATNTSGEIRGQVPGFRDPAVPFHAVAERLETGGPGGSLAITFPSAPYRRYLVSETADFIESTDVQVVGAAQAVETTYHAVIDSPSKFYIITEL